MVVPGGRVDHVDRPQLEKRLCLVRRHERVLLHDQREGAGHVRGRRRSAAEAVVSVRQRVDAGVGGEPRLIETVRCRPARSVRRPLRAGVGEGKREILRVEGADRERAGAGGGVDEAALGHGVLEPCPAKVHEVEKDVARGAVLLDPEAVLLQRIECGLDVLPRRLRAGLYVLRRHHQVPRPLAVHHHQLEVEVLRALRPVVPAQERRRGGRPEQDPVDLHIGGELVEEVAIGVGEDAVPVTQGVIARGLHEDDAVGVAGVGDRLAEGARPVAGIAPGTGQRRRVRGDVGARRRDHARAGQRELRDPLGGLGRRRRRREQQRRSRRHVVDHLCAGGPLRVGGVERTHGGGGGDLPREDGAVVAAEGVDDSEGHAEPVDAGAVPRIGACRSDALAQDHPGGGGRRCDSRAGLERREGAVRDDQTGQRAEVGERDDRHAGIDQAAVVRGDLRTERRQRSQRPGGALPVAEDEANLDPRVSSAPAGHGAVGLFGSGYVRARAGQAVELGVEEREPGPLLTAGGNPALRLHGGRRNGCAESDRQHDCGHRREG